MVAVLVANKIKVEFIRKEPLLLDFTYMADIIQRIFRAMCNGNLRFANGMLIAVYSCILCLTCKKVNSVCLSYVMERPCNK